MPVGPAAPSDVPVTIASGLKVPVYGLEPVLKAAVPMLLKFVLVNPVPEAAAAVALIR